MSGTLTLELVHTRCLATRVEELDQEKLPGLFDLKYHALDAATEKLGSNPQIRQLSTDFQEHLHVQTRVAWEMLYNPFPWRVVPVRPVLATNREKDTAS